MIVRCANCQTEFSLDDRQVGPEGAPVRCSVCHYVFRVDPPANREATWHIQTVEHLSFTAPDLQTLRQWIREGRLHPDDEVSRTGRNWLRLGDMPEFSELFRGFGGLPEVFVEVTTDGASAMDQLGPPPTFGTETTGTPVEAVVPAPSEIIEVPIDRGSDDDDDGDDSTRVHKVIAAVDGVVDEPRAELDEEEETTVAAAVSHPVTETTSGRLHVPEAGTPQPIDDGLRPRARDGSDAVPESVIEAHGSYDTSIGRHVAIDDAQYARQVHTDDDSVEEIDDVEEVHDAEPDDVEEIEDLDSGLLEPARAGSTAVVRRVDVLDTDDDDEADALADRRRTDIGIPLPIPRRASQDEVAGEEPAPASMLDAVTAHVKPITRAAIESDARRPERHSEPEDDAASSGSGSAARAAQEPASASTSASVSASLSAAALARRSPDTKEPARSWPLFAGLGVLVGVAVVFGIPSIRNSALGWAGFVVGDPADAVDPVVQVRNEVDGVIAGMDPAKVDAMRTKLRDAIEQADGGRDKAQFQLLQTEVVAAVVFENRIKAAIAVQAARVAGKPIPAVVDAASDSATELEGAVQALPSVAAAAAASVPAARAEVRASIARAVVPRSLGGLGQDAVAAQLQLFAIASPWLTEPDAKVPAGLIGGLVELPSPSATSSLLLALAEWRAGDEASAVAEARALLTRVPGQPTAQALIAAVAVTNPAVAATAADGGAAEGVAADGGAAEGVAADGVAADGGAVAGSATAGDTGGAVADTGADADDGDEPVLDGDDGGAVAPPPNPAARLSTDQLIDRGCTRVESGDAKAGVDFLKRAFERRPGDIDALTCLGQGYAKLGRTSTALTYYERALGVSPRFRGAVVGAAKMSAKLGRTNQAVRYYKTLLEIDPGHTKAKAYVDAHGTPAPKPAPTTPSSDGGGSEPPPAPAGGDADAPTPNP